MNADQLTPVVRRWLRHTEATPPDARRSARQVVARMPYVRQRSRWWPLPAFGRRASWVPPASDRDDRSQAIPVTTDRFPIVIGRTQTMLSPVKAITAGALVFAIGGLFLVTQPFDQQGGVPGAEEGAELADPVEVTITYSETDVTVVQDEVCTDSPVGGYEMCTIAWSVPFSATDPRLSGAATYRVNEMLTGVIFEAYAIELVNDKGAWVGTGRHASAPVDATLLTLTGEGAYEGFSAVVFMDTSGPDVEPMVMQGVIIEGELPPFPELRAE